MNSHLGTSVSPEPQICLFLFEYIKPAIPTTPHRNEAIKIEIVAAVDSMPVLKPAKDKTT